MAETIPYIVAQDDPGLTSGMVEYDGCKGYLSRPDRAGTAGGAQGARQRGEPGDRPLSLPRGGSDGERDETGDAAVHECDLRLPFGRI